MNECNQDKVEVVQEAMSLSKVKVDALIHDDACHFQDYITRRKNLKNMFKGIRYYVVDEFHRGNHKCTKKTLTPVEKSRFKNVRTNMSEVFNSWIRRKNFVLNGMNAYSHRFWVQESIHFWNNNLQSMPAIGSRRSTASTRKRPASSSSTLKRPAAAAKK